MISRPRTVNRRVFVACLLLLFLAVLGSQIAPGILKSRAASPVRTESLIGQWSAPIQMPAIPIHTRRRRRQMLYAFEAAVRRAGIPYGRNVRGGLTYHDLRRTFATKLRAAGVHEYDIADLLGHSTTSTERRDTKVTRGYSHAVPSRLREAVESICTLNVVEFRRKQA